MARRMYDLDNGVETIKVASVDTPMITSNQIELLSYDDDENKLYVGPDLYFLDYIDISAVKSIVLRTEEYGSVSLNDEGLTVSAPSLFNYDVTLEKILVIGKYTSALRPTANEGSIIYDSTLKKCILYNGTAWVNLDGTALS